MECPIYVFFLLLLSSGVMFKKALPHLRSQRFTPVFSPQSFRVLALTFISLVHAELIFVCDV